MAASDSPRKKMTRSVNTRPSSNHHYRNNNNKNNSAKADDSIIRGAAIIRDHINRLDRSNSSNDCSFDSNESPVNVNNLMGNVGDKKSRFQRRRRRQDGGQEQGSLTFSSEDDEGEDNNVAYDPFQSDRRKEVDIGLLPRFESTVKEIPAKHSRRPRPVSPDDKKDTEKTLTYFDFGSGGFGDSVTAGETLASSSSPPNCGGWAFYEEDVSVTMSVRSSQPDTDPCPPVTPPNRPRPHTQVPSKVTVSSILSPGDDEDDSEEEEEEEEEDAVAASNDENNDDAQDGYDFVDRMYNADDEFDMRDYDEVVGNKQSYLPKHMTKTYHNGVSKRQQNSKSKQYNAIKGVVSKEENEQDIKSPPRGKKEVRSDVSQDVISPLSMEYYQLQEDQAYVHAQDAGHLWQSLVGSQVRFPSSWWNGARGPPMGLTGTQKWQFFGRYPSSNPNLRRYCKHRSAPGRLLLHVIVQDLVTWKPVQDIVVGLFDPNARGIRKTDQAKPGQEDRRELWLAVRKRLDSESIIDSFLAKGRTWQEEDNCKSPLGPKERVTNCNVRAVFGEEPPVESIFVHESTLYERLVRGKKETPPLFLVREFVFC